MPTLDLLQMVSEGCCDNTFLCKTCLHAVYHQSITVFPNLFSASAPFSDKQMSIAPYHA